MKIIRLIFSKLPEGRFKDGIRRHIFKMTNYLFYLLSYFSVNKEKVLLDEKRKIYGNFYKIPFIHFDMEYGILKGYTNHYTPKEGDTVIDAGAFHGVYTIYASKLVGNTGKIYAFEPEELSYRMLLKNIKLNNLSNVVVIKKGLWSKNCSMGFRTFKAGNSISCFSKDKTETTSINLVKLDDYVEENNIKKIDFIKMDIECAELEALSGMKNTIEKGETNFAIASYHRINGEKTCYKLESLFERAGYKTFTGFSNHLTTYAWNRK